MTDCRAVKYLLVTLAAGYGVGPAIFADASVGLRLLNFGASR